MAQPKKIPGPAEGFTPRVWKVLGASTELETSEEGSKRVTSREGYQYGGSEVRCVAHLTSLGLLKSTEVGPAKKLAKATAKGCELYDAFLAAHQ